MPIEALATFAGAFGCAFFLSCWMVHVIRRHAVDWGFLDRPSQRKAHSRVVPLGGGLAIWCSLVVFFALVHVALVIDIPRAANMDSTIGDFWQAHADGLKATFPQLWSLLGLATILVGLGLADDIWGLPWQFRMLVEVIVAAAVVWGLRWQLTAFLPWPAVTAVLSVIWIVGLINSFNMLDNMDGLASGVALIVSLALATVVLMAPDPQTGAPQWFVAGFLIVFAGAVAGFLWHNRPPAQIFMGDAGSYFIGFCIGTITLVATFASYTPDSGHAILAPLCILAVPLYDMTTVIWIRIRRGRSPFHADRNHFSHRLVDLGLSRGAAVATICLLTATCCLAAIVLHRVDRLGAWLLLVLIICILVIVRILESVVREKDADARQ